MVEILQEAAQLIVRISGQEYARYAYGASVWKPYLCPIRAANGLSFLADAPLDHRHHHGFWVGHGRVDDTDFWLERHNSGRIVHREWEEITQGADSGGWTQVCAWTAASGKVLLHDTRTFTFYTTPQDARHFDFEIVLSAPAEETVTLSPTNQAGIPHLRVAEGLTPRTGGMISNAAGQKNEKGTYKQSSPWVDCSGTLGRLKCGIALFDHPENPDFPTPWFTRDYGPVSPNYGFFREDPLEITPDEPLRLRYRVFTHTGDAQEGGVAAAWETYRAETIPDNVILVSERAPAMDWAR
jgi:hypothetical protein